MTDAKRFFVGSGIELVSNSLLVNEKTNKDVKISVRTEELTIINMSTIS